MFYIRTHPGQRVPNEEAKSPSEVAADELKRVRTRKGWNQQELADQLNKLGVPVDRATISKIETGDRRITLDEVFWFAYALGVTPQALVLPRRLGSYIAVTPKRTLETEQGAGWLRGYFFARESDVEDEDEDSDYVFFLEERIEEDALAWRRYPELSSLRDEAAIAVRFAMSKDREDRDALRHLLGVLQELAKDALKRLDREEQSGDARPRRRATKSPSRKRKERG